MALRAIAPTTGTTTETHKLFIGLHGWGANAQDLAAVADFLPLPGYRMMFPDGPFPHPYNPAGRMWYGFPAGYTFQTPHDFEQQADLQVSRQRLRDWLTEVSAQTQIPLEQTVLAGFSQGGAMAMDVGAQLPLAGLIVLSGYLHAPPQPHPQLGPILIVHGRQDAVVPLARAHQSRDTLAAHSEHVTYQEFDMGHEVSPLVLQQIAHFCNQQI